MLKRTQDQHSKKKMVQLNKKVESLRAVLLTKEQVDAFVPNLSALGQFTDIDKEMMESFKKILHLGTNQLSSFVSDLDIKGKDLDGYSIVYYTTQLKNGPLAGILQSILTQGKYTTYWTKTPDVIGVSIGTQFPSLIETPIGILPAQSTFNQPVTTLTKMPSSVIDRDRALDESANSIIRAGINGCLKLEEEYEGKSYEARVAQETNGEYSKTAHGSYLVADTTTFLALEAIREDAFDKIKSILGDEDYRMFIFKRDFNPYDPASNVSLTSNLKVERKVDEGSDVVIETDLGGSVFESDEVREFYITIPTQNKDAKLRLHTVKGQLGDVEKVKIDPLNQ